MREGVSTHRVAAIWMTAVVVIATVAAACKKPERPAADVWAHQWHELYRALPTRDAILAARDPRGLCSEALARARTAEKELFPAPDEVIAAAARSWFRAMLGVYMRCETDGAHDELDAAFEHAARIEQELEAALQAAQR